MNSKRIFTSSMLLSLIVAGVWTAFMSYRPENIKNTMLSSLPDGFMEGVHALILDKNGQPKIIIDAPRMVHYAEDDMTKLTKPLLTIYRKSPKPWYVTSRMAKAMHGIDTVHFWRDVTIHHKADAKEPETVIKTESLTVYPNKDTAETNDAITLQQPNLIVKAIGMYADMNIGEVKLHANVRGIYEPH